VAAFSHGKRGNRRLPRGLPVPPSGSWIGRVRPTDSIAQRRWVDAHQLVKKAHEQPEGAAREGLACSDWMVVSASAVT
jgi:hypothetical protein